MKKLFAFLTVLGLLGAAGNAATIKISPTFGSPTDTAFVLSAINAAKNGIPLPGGILSFVTPNHLMTKNDGVGAILWVVDVTAISGETVSLTDVKAVLSSTDSGDLFGKIASFEGASYSPSAPGIRIDETEITSGPASQQAKRIIVGIWSKSFTVGSSRDEQSVRDWFFAFSNWSTIATVTAGGASVRAVLRKMPPPLIVSLSSTNTIKVFAVNNGDTNRDYRVLTAPSVTGPWSDSDPEGLGIRAGVRGLDFGPATGSQGFFRLVTP